MFIGGGGGVGGGQEKYQKIDGNSLDLKKEKKRLATAEFSSFSPAGEREDETQYPGTIPASLFRRVPVQPIPEVPGVRHFLSLALQPEVLRSLARKDVTVTQLPLAQSDGRSSFRQSLLPVGGVVSQAQHSSRRGDEDDVWEDDENDVYKDLHL